jgi:hypothetical protein
MRRAGAGALALALAGCSVGMTGASQRPDLSGCDADDFSVGNVVFFGLTDNLGPGTIMKRRAGKGVEFLLGSVVADQDLASTLIHRGVDWSCALGDSMAREFNANRAVGILPVSAEANAKLSRASHLEVTVTSARWDDLLAGPYRAMIEHLSDARLKEDLLNGRDLIVSRAFAVKGIKVTALYDPASGASAKAALGDGPRRLIEGKVTAVVNLAWQGTTKLVITVPSEVYIAGQFRTFGPGGSPASDGTVGAIAPSGQMLVRAGP